jgi:hypothetical protein
MKLADVGIWEDLGNLVRDLAPGMSRGIRFILETVRQ